MGFVPDRHCMNSSYYVYFKMAKGQCRKKNCVYFENRAKGLAECRSTSKKRLLAPG